MSDATLQSDRPITAASDDRLGYAPFSRALARSLTTMLPPEGLVISVEGAWGSGKTSALQMAIRGVKASELNRITERSVEELESLSLEELDKEWQEQESHRRLHVIYFNPWIFSGQENLVRAFFAEISRAIDFNQDGRLANAFNGVRDRLPSIGAMIGAGAAAYATLGLGAAAGGAAGRAAGEAIGQRREPTLESSKKELTTALQEVNERIIVVIDDIDRLAPADMKTVFSTVKSVGDLPNVAYVLSFDREVVSKALAKGDAGVDPSYLEKIIQVSLSLPRPETADLLSLFLSRVNLIIGAAEPSNKDRWASMVYGIILPYLTNPRDVSRIGNMLQVIYPSTYEGTDLSDLITLTVIRASDPNLYGFIVANAAYFVGDNMSFVRYEDFLKGIDYKGFHSEEVAKKALSYLFPQLAHKLKQYVSSHSDQAQMRRERRLGTPEFYRNYFTLGVSPDFLTADQVIRALREPDTLRGMLKHSQSTSNRQGLSRASNVIEQITDECIRSGGLSLELSAVVISEAEALIKIEDRDRSLLADTNFSRLTRLFRASIGSTDASTRDNYFLDLSKTSGSLLLRSAIVTEEAAAHGKFGLSGSSADQTVASETVERAAEVIVAEIESAAASGTLIGPGRNSSLLLFWHRAGDPAKLRAWVDTLLKSEENAVALGSMLAHLDERLPDKSRHVSISMRRNKYREMFDIDLLESIISKVSDQSERKSLAREILEELNRAFKLGEEFG